MNTDHRQYLKCRHHLRMHGGVENVEVIEVEAEVVEAVHQTMNRYSASA